VATILLIFLRINLTNLVQFKRHSGEILSVIKALGLSPSGNCIYGYKYESWRMSVLRCRLKTFSNADERVMSGQGREAFEFQLRAWQLASLTDYVAKYFNKHMTNAPAT